MAEHLLTKPMKQKYAEDMKFAKLSLLAGLGSLGFYQPGGDFWCLWLQRNQRQIWGLISWARKPWSISVCISGKDFLQFRSWNCSNTLLEGRKIGNRRYSCPEQAIGGFLLWEIQNCYFEFKIRTVGFGGYFFVVFLISASCWIGMFTLPTWLCAVQSLCCQPMQRGIGEYLKVKVLLEMVTVSLNFPHKAWSLR